MAFKSFQVGQPVPSTYEARLLRPLTCDHAAPNLSVEPNNGFRGYIIIIFGGLSIKMIIQVIQVIQEFKLKKLVVVFYI